MGGSRSIGTRPRQRRYARKERLPVAADLAADFGVNAVGADHDVSAMRLSVCQMKPDAALLLVESNATAVEMQPAGRAGVEGLAQNAVKIASMHHPVWRAVERA